jgi:DNA/RNA-binding domain of Phe-tRNA-synthetase-like protein
MRYTIAPEVFARHPGYVRGVVIGRSVRNSPELPAEALALLRTAESLVRIRPDLNELALHDHISNWRMAYAAFGARPSKYLSSIEALARRVRKGEPLRVPSTLVALTNAVSLHYLVPAGAHDAGQANDALCLRPARGDETFLPLGETEVEHPEPGEIIYADGDVVICRRWTWRQAQHTAMRPETSHVAVNVDGLPPVTRAETLAICGELAELIRRFCGGVVAVEMLEHDHPVIEV